MTQDPLEEQLLALYRALPQSLRDEVLLHLNKLHNKAFGMKSSASPISDAR